MKSNHLLIQPPPRSSLAGTILIISTAVLLSIVSFSLRVSPWAFAFAVLLSVAAVLVREKHAFHLSFFTVLFVAVPLFYPALPPWPLKLLAPIIVYLAFMLPVPRLRASLTWVRRGRFGQDDAVLVVMTAIVSGIALCLWFWLLKPDLSVHLLSIPAMPIWLYPLAGLGFSIGNAAMEEFVFRGLVMQSLDSAIGPGIPSVMIQAWLFGVVHYLRGFPNGMWGLFMAGIYGFMLGVLRRRSQGMLAPWLAHICADMVIFAILAGIALAW